jgi:putative transport protein
MAGGAAVTVLTAALALVTGRHGLRTPAGVTLGMVAGVHTQPAGLAFATDTARDESPNLGYASVSPIATVTKILLAQLLLGSGR